MASYLEETSLCKCCHEKLNLNTTAICQCQQCKVSFCESCAKKHSQSKVTSSHNLVDLKPPKVKHHAKKRYSCDICSIDCDGEAFCRTCTILLCKSCLRQHKLVHSPREITRDNSTSMDVCLECKRYGTLTVSDKLCLGCVNNFCQECCKGHKCRNVTGRDGIALDVPKCEPCEKMTIFTTAKTMCTDCDEFLCCQCSEHHSFSFENHKQKMLTLYGKAIKNINLCEHCCKASKEEKATSMCLDCHNKLFCELCAVQHISFKRTKHHKVSSIASSPSFTDNKETQTESIEKNDKETETFPNEDSLNLYEYTPGKPEASYIGIDSVTLVWKEAKAFDKSDNYQVSYKETDIQSQWTLYNDSLDLKVSNITVKHLKTNTAYRFRIRLVSTEGEGPYSQASDKVITRTSCAGMLMSFSKKLQDGNPLPSIYALPLKENVDQRNAKAKTKWFEIGEVTKGRTSTEKTIMIFGTTDCGKGSVIDGLINYIIGVQWTDTFRFSTRSKELREDIKANWINIFSVRPEQGSRLQYRLNIVEIPPFDISKPLNENLGIIERIRDLVWSTAPLRLELLDAICFVVKSTDTQLTKFQEVMFGYVLSIFGKDLSGNIFTLLTFADLKDPPFLEFICETKMPIGKTFKFNSSALFEKNVGLEPKSTFQMFWQTSEEFIGKFFEELEKTPSQSLRQTNYLIEQELLSKAIFEKIQKELDKVLKKANELNTEQNKIEQEEDTIKKNENFKIVKDKTISTLTELSPGSYALNCNDCKNTCCTSVDSAHTEIESCDVMDSSGKCKVCVSRCLPKSHVIQSDAYVLSTEKITNVDQMMEDAYRNASTELHRLEHRVQILGRQMNDLCDNLQKEADSMNECRQEIHQNSLWQNVQGLESEIELRIEMLKEERSEGFIDEIRRLKEFRKYLEATKNVHQFTEDARSILKVVGRNCPKNVAATTNLTKLTALFKLLHLE